MFFLYVYKNWESVICNTEGTSYDLEEIEDEIKAKDRANSLVRDGWHVKLIAGTEISFKAFKL